VVELKTKAQTSLLGLVANLLGNKLYKKLYTIQQRQRKKVAKQTPLTQKSWKAEFRGPIYRQGSLQLSSAGKL